MISRTRPLDLTAEAVLALDHLKPRPPAASALPTGSYRVTIEVLTSAPRVPQHRSLIMTPLRQRMLQDMGIRNLALNTQLAYVQQISAFARHFDCSPEALGPEQVRAYQVHLLEERKLAAGSLSVVAAACASSTRSRCGGPGMTMTSRCPSGR